MENPFAGYGSIVKGSRFVGRKKEIQKLKACTLGDEYGCVAIMGLPRIGKSSLAWQVFKENEEMLNKENTYVIWQAMATLNTNMSNTSTLFFKKMVLDCDDELEIKTNSDSDLASRYKKIVEKVVCPLKTVNDEESIRSLVLKYFKFVRKILNFKIIFVLDEFDSVKNYFDVADFQLLRELAYNPDSKLCLVTCSRKTIDEIESKDGAISNFAGIFSDLRLGVFSEEDAKEYWTRYQESWPINNDYISDVFYLTGNHPWLMDIVNFLLFDCGTKENVKENIPSLNLMNNLDGIVSTLEKENLLNAAIQVVIGPVFDVNPKQIEQLERYNFIRKIPIAEKERIFNGSLVGPRWNDYAYVCFSDYSTLDFRRRFYANLPYFSIWSETENMLRHLVKDFLDKQYGGVDWQEKLKQELQKNPPSKCFKLESWEKNINDLKSNRDNIVKQFPVMKEYHLVDFTLTAQIFDIFIRPKHTWFNQYVFKGEWKCWNDKFSFLTLLTSMLKTLLIHV